MSSYAIRSLAASVACLVALAANAGVAAAQFAPVDARLAPHDSVSSTTTAVSERPATRDAQSATAEQAGRTIRGPQLRPAGLQAATAVRVAPADADRDKDVSVGSNLALMGVGAAAVVIGLLVGGDGGTAIAVGGGVLGLVGLYRYLR